MFASFIDLKIISIIDAKKSEPNIKIFDDRIKKYKRGDANTSIYDFKMESPKALFDLHEIDNELIKKLSLKKKNLDQFRVVKSNQVEYGKKKKTSKI